ncbi:zeta toxin family protein [Protofrankia symbiont of Coriaria ruscifolia]|uniref:zeta toxin family protein n=1 Tax=Protofrankia symbiont of Coriaria ruscifolia TaxID=1306542 RepID=UPI0013EFACE7|nr:zeta toxin family protein [Protofrankia symbiont of Coriaria ruscifolia]
MSRAEEPPTPAELDRIYRTEVRPYLFDTALPAQDPLLVLLGGQPGAGKSQAARAVQQRHPQAALLALTGDALRPFAPGYQELMAGDDRRMPNITQRVTGPWVRRAIDEALNNRISLLLEGTFRDPATTVDTAARFAGQGYWTEAVALAVRAERSRLDSVDRYYELVASGLPGRWTPPTAHDNAYTALPDTVAAAAASPKVHRLVVTNRAGDDLYLGGVDQADRQPAALAALDQARAIPFFPVQAREWLDRLHLNAIRATQAGRLDAVSRPVFTQLLQDARVILPMAHPPGSAEHHSETRHLEHLERTVTAPNPLRAAFPASPHPGRPPTTGGPSAQGPEPPQQHQQHRRTL